MTEFDAVPRTADGTDLSRVHLVGAGGAGMNAIARILADRGLDVSGSDAKGSHVLTGLSVRGVRTAVGHRAENLDLIEGGPTAVVVSSAIRPDNPEVVEARRRGIPIVRRAVALAALMTDHRSVCVAGTHGKTSTTSMLTVALQNAGLDPSFAIGGELNESGAGAHHGSGDIFVAEADESDGSFLAFTPHGAIVTNLEPDHLDHHGTAEAYAAVFDQFVERIAPGGFLVAGVDDPGVQALLERVRSSGPGQPRIVGYGRGENADVRLGPSAVDGHHTAADLTLPDGTVIRLQLAVPGEHMMLNAAGALTAGVLLGVDSDTMAQGLARYTGVRRRFEFKGRAGEVVVYDDYAHHPTEVRAQLQAARSIVPADGRLVVVFQPHLYSRTLTFAAEFGAALGLADVAVVLDVYGAREDPQPGVTGALVAERIDGAQVVYEPSLGAAPDTVAGLVRPGDVVVTMGAGDVTMLGPRLLDLLTDGSGAG
ncbi:UDP-N-acetylmuramate--L-alanine ligase [Nakamurella lactea]|uniref:UDP-N-acetylmuramate--L-alanine ligase n=1 Tax=Nakamurella lactea TaxID=459515 RepID=UPI00040B8B4B|nr:UDP-N-acetylmuramate--L-alanine ligase [Nakamurella lactea]